MKRFETIVDNEEFGILRCNTCGYQFDFDVHDEENLIMCEDKGWLKPKCPACNFTEARPEKLHICEDDGKKAGVCRFCGRSLV